MSKKIFVIFIFPILVFFSFTVATNSVSAYASYSVCEAACTADGYSCTTAETGFECATDKKISGDNSYFGKKGDSIGQYINSIYKYAIGVVGILATIVIMIGGLIWITSMGNAQRVSSAKDWIGSALTGLALAMFSYTLLYIINPDLVNFKGVNPDKVGDIDSETRLNTSFGSYCEVDEPTGIYSGTYDTNGICVNLTPVDDDD
jgi:hypothetical protein